MKKEKLDELKKAIEEGNRNLEDSGDSARIFYDYKVVHEKEDKVRKDEEASKSIKIDYELLCKDCDYIAVKGGKLFCKDKNQYVIKEDCDKCIKFNTNWREFSNCIECSHGSKKFDKEKKAMGFFCEERKVWIEDPRIYCKETDCKSYNKDLRDCCLLC